MSWTSDGLQVARWLRCRGTAIRRLDIWTPDCYETQGWRHLQDASMLMLPQLPNLQHLSVSGGREFMIPERHLYALELLPSLQQFIFCVQLDGDWSESRLEPLGHLKALTSLRLTIRDMIGPLLISPALTQLQELHLCCDGGSCDATSQAHLMQTVSKLMSLQSLALDNMVESPPAELERLVHLTYLELSSLGLEDPLLAASPAFGLCTKLEHVSLSYVGNASDSSWQHFCKSLQVLPRLDSLHITDTDLGEVHPYSWALPPNLTTLTLFDCSISVIPAAICCLSNLQQLCLTDSAIDDELARLPKEPYLRSLLSLNINEPEPGAGPEALTDAPCLQNLTVLIRKTAQPLWTAAVLQHLVPEDCMVSVTAFDDPCPFLDQLWQADL